MGQVGVLRAGQLQQGAAFVGQLQKLENIQRGGIAHDVIGINTAKASTGEGLGFAIPINTAKPIVNQFIETGAFQKVTLGIQCIDAQYYEQATGIETGADSGVFVAKIDADSVAFKSGLMVNDVIVKMDNAKIEQMQDLVKYLYTVKKGDTVKAQVLREGKKVDLEFAF